MAKKSTNDEILDAEAEAIEAATTTETAAAEATAETTETAAAEATEETTEPDASAMEGESAEPEAPREITLAEALAVVFAHCPGGSAANESGQVAWDGGKVIINSMGVAL